MLSVLRQIAVNYQGAETQVLVKWRLEIWLISFFSLSLSLYFFPLWLLHIAYGISVLQLETELKSPQVEAPNPNHWTPRELPRLISDCNNFEGLEYVLHPPGKLLYSFLFQVAYYLCNPIVIYYFGVLVSFTPVQVSFPNQRFELLWEKNSILFLFVFLRLLFKKI